MRRLRHLKFLLRQGDASLLPVLKDMFLLLPPSIRWFQEWGRYREDVDELPEGTAAVLAEVLAVQRSNLAEAGVDVRLSDVARLVTASPLDFAVQVLERTAKAAGVDGLDPIDIELFRLCTRLCMDGVYTGALAGGMLARTRKATDHLLSRFDAVVTSLGDDFATR